MQTPRINVYSTYIVGFLYGLLYAYGDFHQKGWLLDPMITQASEGMILMLFMPFALRLYQQYVHDRMVAPVVQAAEHRTFYRYEGLTYLLFLLSSSKLTGIKPSFALTLALFGFLILCQAVLFLAVLNREKRFSLLASEKYIAVLFLVSGFSALIYQVVWQRVLFTTFGINSEAVTVIVSVFMFGLGVGALAGGYLQSKFTAYLLPIFVGLEILIGIFGAGALIGLFVFALS